MAAMFENIDFISSGFSLENRSLKLLNPTQPPWSANIMIIEFSSLSEIYVTISLSQTLTSSIRLKYLNLSVSIDSSVL